MEYIKKYLKENHNKDKITLIGVDGLGGAGKSTYSEEVYDCLTNCGYNCYIFHLDDFIYKKEIRYNDSYSQDYCYYNLQWRYDYLIEKILKKAQNDTPIEDSIELYNKKQDNYYLKKIKISKGSIIIIEGIFLQRKEICDYFSYIIYIDVPQNIRLQRVLKRDSYIGNRQEILKKYKERYIPAEEKYFFEYKPDKSANYIKKM